ncbi:hypothetical protein C8R44DRAFT_895619 [Mycena epipterygia]|nr:hypothetical protein C8R44DRAFT_895619 [Mycena epipterygia]
MSKHNFKDGFDTPLELWTEVVKLNMPDGLLDPLGLANFRRDLASVSKSWMDRVYSDPSFWTTLRVNQHVKMVNLAFVLGRCGDTRAIDLQISLHNVRCVDSPVISPTVQSMVDAIFNRVGSYSHRRKSFTFATEHPGAFLSARKRCKVLQVPILKTLTLCYSYLPGYSQYPSSDVIYRRPFVTRTWFANSLSALEYLDVVSVPLRWKAGALFANLVELKISDPSSAHSPALSIFAALFDTAVNLRVLRLGPIRPFTIPLKRCL